METKLILKYLWDVRALTKQKIKSNVNLTDLIRGSFLNFRVAFIVSLFSGIARKMETGLDPMHITIAAVRVLLR